jgi:hypothetical protein
MRWCWSWVVVFLLFTFGKLSRFEFDVRCRLIYEKHAPLQIDCRFRTTTEFIQWEFTVFNRTHSILFGTFQHCWLFAHVSNNVEKSISTKSMNVSMNHICLTNNIRIETLSIRVYRLIYTWLFVFSLLLLQKTIHRMHVIARQLISFSQW